jgi:hypothetical protein
MINKPGTAAITPTGINNHINNSNNQKDFDRGIKRETGVIREVNVRGDNKLYVFVDLPSGNGTLRPFGQDKTPVLIVDSPLDILLRWGGVRPGQIVELFYRGIGETGQAAAHIIGDENEEFVNAREAPEQGFSVASSLPFEPMGII